MSILLCPENWVATSSGVMYNAWAACTFSAGITCPYFYAQKTGWQPVVESCIMPGLPAHLVQELHVHLVQPVVELHVHTSMPRKLGGKK